MMDYQTRSHSDMFLSLKSASAVGDIHHKNSN